MTLDKEMLNTLITKRTKQRQERLDNFLKKFTGRFINLERLKLCYCHPMDEIIQHQARPMNHKGY